MMGVNLLCNRSVATIGAGQGVAEAATLMRDRHVGNLIVVEPRGGALVPVGILTDRDIVVAVISKGIDAELRARP